MAAMQVFGNFALRTFALLGAVSAPGRRDAIVRNGWTLASPDLALEKLTLSLEAWMACVEECLQNDLASARDGGKFVPLFSPEVSLTRRDTGRGVRRLAQSVHDPELRIGIDVLLDCAEESFADWAMNPGAVTPEVIGRSRVQICAAYAQVKQRLALAARNPV